MAPRAPLPCSQFGSLLILRRQTRCGWASKPRASSTSQQQKPKPKPKPKQKQNHDGSGYISQIVIIFRNWIAHSGRCRDSLSTIHAHGYAGTCLFTFQSLILYPLPSTLCSLHPLLRRAVVRVGLELSFFFFFFFFLACEASSFIDTRRGYSSRSSLISLNTSVRPASRPSSMCVVGLKYRACRW